MIKNLIYGILIIAVLSGCTTSVKNDLINKVDKECGSSAKSVCTIALKDVTKFKWDKMYLFGDWTTSDSITKAIGFNYNGDDVPDDYIRMIFIYGRAVAHEEDFDSALDFQDATDSLPKGTHFFTVSNAIFEVEKTKTNGACKTCFDFTLSARKK